MLQEEEGDWFCRSLLLCQNSSTIFSDVIFLVSTAVSGQERSFGKKFCPASAALSASPFEFPLDSRGSGL